MHCVQSVIAFALRFEAMLSSYAVTCLHLVWWLVRACVCLCGLSKNQFGSLLHSVLSPVEMWHTQPRGLSASTRDIV
jgi:hypothetical protein